MHRLTHGTTADFRLNHDSFDTDKNTMSLLCWTLRDMFVTRSVVTLQVEAQSNCGSYFESMLSFQHHAMLVDSWDIKKRAGGGARSVAQWANYGDISFLELHYRKDSSLEENLTLSETLSNVLLQSRSH